MNIKNFLVGYAIASMFFTLGQGFFGLVNSGKPEGVQLVLAPGTNENNVLACYRENNVLRCGDLFKVLDGVAAKEPALNGESL